TSSRSPPVRSVSWAEGTRADRGLCSRGPPPASSRRPFAPPPARDVRLTTAPATSLLPLLPRLAVREIPRHLVHRAPLEVGPRRAGAPDRVAVRRLAAPLEGVEGAVAPVRVERRGLAAHLVERPAVGVVVERVEADAAGQEVEQFVDPEGD